MARLPLRHEDDPDTDPAILAALDRVAPEALDGFMGFVMSIYNTGTGAGHSSITANKTELAYTTATVANTCHY